MVRNLIDKDKVKNVIKKHFEDASIEKVEHLAQEIILSADPIVYLLIRKKNHGRPPERVYEELKPTSA